MKKQIFKLLFIPSILAITAPTIAMSSCASVSQWIIPLTTNGDINMDAAGLNSAVDHANEEIFQYAPQSYVYSSATSNDTMHVFCKPTNPENTQESLPEQYYSVTNNEIKTVDKTDEDNVKKIFKNINLLQMSNGVLSVSNNISHLFSFLLAYQSRSEIFDINEMAKLYGIDPSNPELKSLYEKNTQNNLDFFEFNFAFNNLLTEGKSSVKFDASNTNFKFKNFAYGSGTEPFAYGPIANSNIEEYFVGKIDRKTTDKSEVGYPLKPGEPTANYGYDEHVLLSEVKDGDKKTVTPSIIRQIPIPISDIEMNLSFYNPLEAKSFLPNSWLINDKNVINEKISGSQAWKKFEENTGTKPEIKNVSWNLNCSVNNQKMTNVWPTNVDSIFNMYKDSLAFSDFIVLANYSVSSEKNEDQEHPANTDRSMIFSGISGIYPAFFFTNEKAFIETEVEIPGIEDKVKRYFVDKTYLDERIKNLNDSLVQHKDNDDMKKLIQYSFKNGDTFTLSDFLKRWF